MYYHWRPATKRIASEDVDADDKEDPLDSSPDSDYKPGPPVRKQRRKGSAAAKKRKPTQKPEQYSLRGIEQWGIDELYVVFAFVYPMDLLNLARTCKYLRSFLMHKSSRFLWNDALSRVEGLPACPADLTEPQYTNLVFYNHCHGCDRSAASVLWNLRRRYCSACKIERLCCPRYCIFYIQISMPRDVTTVGGSRPEPYVDKSQLDALIRECDLSTAKKEFLARKQDEYLAISEHAYLCAEWQRGHGRVKRFDLEILRKERQTSIFKRLRQQGYGPEIDYFGDDLIQDSYEFAFKSHTLLTDNEWEQLWPEWVDVMNEYRMERMDATCFQLRRDLLVSEYNEYVEFRAPGTPTFDILPHVADLACFPPFQGIIEAPEESQMGEEPFAPAFAQLPTLLGEWKQQLDFALAELVKIPPHLTLQDTSSCDVESSDAAELHPMDLAKLHLACALFSCDRSDLFTHSDVLFPAMRYHAYPSYPDDRTDSDTTQDRLKISFLEEAPYIVHACGLDPSVATADDMDRRNPRLRCLYCQGFAIMNWRDAMWHASRQHSISAYDESILCSSKSSHWQVISDDHMDAIQAIEKSVEGPARAPIWRCLLCRPRVGDALFGNNVMVHMQDKHGLNLGGFKEGIHYEHIGLEGFDLPTKVEMVEEGGQVTFRRPQ